MKRVFLQNNQGFKWFTTEHCFVKGYLFDPNGNFYHGSSLLDYFNNIESFVDFHEKVKYANGAFSLIYKKDKTLFVAVDNIRSFPLFYIRSKGSWMLSDNPYYLAENGGFSNLNHTASVEFLATGFVTGNETLLEGIRQVQAGEVINFKEDDLYSKFYYTYRISSQVEEKYKDLKTAGEKIIEKAFGRFVESLQGRTAVVPLSGGYDSRLIAVMLKYFKYKKVICFTYGRKTSSEIAISKKVAENLGFPWIYVEYEPKLIEGFPRDKEFRTYCKTGSNLSSMFFMQEYFAVKKLKEDGFIPVDSIFVPGHSGDFLGGSQLNKHGNFSIQESIADVSERIFNIKYCFVKPNRTNSVFLKERIRRNLQEKFNKEGDFAYSIHEDWDFKEKLAKFNFNSNSIYNFFGYEFRIPFWDIELVNFAKYLPLSAKLNKYLYDDILINQFFDKYYVAFKDELQPKERDIRRMKLKNRLKKHLPEKIKYLFLNKKDPLFYYEITKQLREDLLKHGKKIKIHSNSFNSIIIQWYLEEVKREYDN